MPSSALWFEGLQPSVWQGAFGVVVAMDEAKRRALPASERDRLIDSIRDARPTAVKLAWAVERVREFVSQGR